MIRNISVRNLFQIFNYMFSIKLNDIKFAFNPEPVVYISNEYDWCVKNLNQKKLLDNHFNKNFTKFLPWLENN